MARLKDGYQALISISDAPNIELWEKRITPPGVEGGGMIDTTGMRNSAYRTRYPKALITLSDSSGVCAYDPAVYNTVLANVNVNQEIRLTFSDGSTITFYGWLDMFKPQEMQEGEEPLAEFTIIPSNVDESDAETGPTIA